MLAPQRRRNDQLGHLATDHFFRAVAERVLGGRVELEDSALVVDRDDAVERGVEDSGVTCLPLARRLLGTTSLDEVTDLASERLHCREELVVRDARLAREELDRTRHAARCSNRKTEPGLEACRDRSMGAREVRVCAYVSDPGGLPAFPDTAGQAYTSRKNGSAALERKLRQAGLVVTPDLCAPEHFRVTRERFPERTEPPVERRPDRREDLRVGICDVRRLAEDQRDGMLGRDELICAVSRPARGSRRAHVR